MVFFASATKVASNKNQPQVHSEFITLLQPEIQ